MIIGLGVGAPLPHAVIILDTTHPRKAACVGGFFTPKGTKGEKRSHRPRLSSIPLTAGRIRQGLPDSVGVCPLTDPVLHGSLADFRLSGHVVFYSYVTAPVRQVKNTRCHKSEPVK